MATELMNLVLTELEGAVLSEIHHRGHTTAFQVRRAFQISPSIEWSGSAGAVYPAVKRLQKRGIIDARETQDARGSMHLSLTQLGERALLLWGCDPDRSASVGIDPFRLRSGIWSLLPDEQRLATLRAVESAIEANIESFLSYLPSLDNVETIRVGFSLQVQKNRLNWLREQIQELTSIL